MSAKESLGTDERKYYVYVTTAQALGLTAHTARHRRIGGGGLPSNSIVPAINVTWLTRAQACVLFSQPRKGPDPRHGGDFRWPRLVKARKAESTVSKTIPETLLARADEVIE
jgi:hypothetical protein